MSERGELVAPFDKNQEQINDTPPACAQDVSRVFVSDEAIKPRGENDPGAFTLLFGNDVSGGNPTEKPSGEVSGPAATVPPVSAVAGDHTPSQFTMIFGGTKSPAVHTKAETVSAIEEAVIVTPAPEVGSFTQAFGAPQVAKVRVQPIALPPEAKERAAGGRGCAEDFAVAFNFSLRDKSFVPDEVQKPAPGELTSILNAVDRTTSHVDYRGGNDPGAITKLFAAEVHSVLNAAQNHPVSEFDRSFKPIPGKPRTDVFTDVLSKEKAPVPAPKQIRFSGDVPPSGATQVFTRRDSSTIVPSATEPSEFTQVISVAKVRELKEQTSLQPGTLVETPMLQVPRVPSVPTPQPPALPTVSRPAGLASAAADAARPNWMPVIIGANVFFAIVVILILIFALKRS